METIKTIKCKCGCGTVITPSRCTLWRIKNGKDSGYFRGHYFMGSRNPKWIGGRVHDSKGYIFVLNPSHPNARKKGYVAEHHLVMAEIIKRPIAHNEIVHHKNGIKDDNRPENLELVTRQNHPLSHPPQNKKVYPPKTCIKCGAKFTPVPYNYKRNKYCSKKCSVKSGSEHPNAKFTEQDVLKIRSLQGKMPRKKVAEIFNVKESNIKHIYSRKIWTHI